MGLNVIIACHRHRVETYMMRGEEPIDLQWWMRVHSECFKSRRVDIYRDCDEHPRYPEQWEYEQRPTTLETRSDFDADVLRAKERSDG